MLKLETVILYESKENILYFTNILTVLTLKVSLYVFLNFLFLDKIVFAVVITDHQNL